MTKRKYEHQESDIDRREEAYEKTRAARAMVVGEWLRQRKQATYAAIARQFKEWAGELDAILQTLKVAGVVDWDEYKPAPTLIKYQAMRRIEPKIMPYNSEPIIHKDNRSFPTAAVSDNYFRG